MDIIRRMVSERIRDLRKERKMTQIEVAEAAGLSILGFQRVERGETTPRIETLKYIAKALGVTESDILGTTGVKFEMTPDQLINTVRSAQLSPDEVELLRLFKLASPAQRSAVIKTVANLIKRK